MRYLSSRLSSIRINGTVLEHLYLGLGELPGLANVQNASQDERALIEGNDAQKYNKIFVSKSTHCSTLP